MGFHHLDVFLKNMTKEGDYFYDSSFIVLPATELFQACVRFMKGNANSLKGVSLNDGVLRFPYVEFDNNIEPRLLNLLAFEQIFKDDRGVSSFAFLMNNLVSTAKDVVKLREKGIISGVVGSDDDIASSFNCLTRGVTSEVPVQGENNVNMILNNYCGERLHTWRASFTATYLSDPWVCCSLFVGVIVLASTVLQTVYTVMSYYKGP